MIFEKHYIGETLLFPVTIEETAFSQDTDKWSVRCMVGRLSATCTKKNVDGVWHVELNTSALKSGECYIVVEWVVTDANGTRTEIWKEHLTNLEDA